MDTIWRLRDLLSLAVSEGDAGQYDEQDLFDELMVQRPLLLNVLGGSPRNAQEKREIESGSSANIYATVI
jgi:nuclear pore complex protein Nup205